MLKLSAAIMAGMISIVFPPLLIVTVPVAIVYLADRRGKVRHAQRVRMLALVESSRRRRYEAGKFFA